MPPWTSCILLVSMTNAHKADKQQDAKQENSPCTDGHRRHATH
jgi:hypothetical protein